MIKDEIFVSKMEGKTNFSRRLQAARNRNCWENYRTVKKTAARSGEESPLQTDLTDHDPHILWQIYAIAPERYC